MRQLLQQNSLPSSQSTSHWGVGLGPREDQQFPHTTPWSWALLVGSHNPSQYDCVACRQVHLLLGLNLATLLLQWHLSLCSSWHGKSREVMSANTPVFEVLNTPNQDPACFDKVNYPFWNVLGLLPCSFSWALFVTSRLLLQHICHLVPLSFIHTVPAGDTAATQEVLRTWISGALQRDLSSPFQFKVALDLCSFGKDFCGCDWAGKKVIKKYLFNKTCQ